MSDPDLLPADAEAPTTPASTAPSETMLPHRRGRPPLESAFVRVIATSGVVGIGVALGAILTSQNVAGWITGLVIALVSVILSAVLWSSQRL
jgi:protein-S-isoprenylcysteine O-methyltransferase Ste14